MVWRPTPKETDSQRQQSGSIGGQDQLCSMRLAPPNRVRDPKANGLMTQVEVTVMESKRAPARTEHSRIGMITVLIDIMEHDALLGYDWAHGYHEGQHPRP